jgi:hypothetical protein
VKKVEIFLSFLFFFELSFSCKHEDINDQSTVIKPDKVDGYNKQFDIRAGYILVNELSDEFNGTSLDKAKWIDYHPYWSGRGSTFLPSNVSVGGGYLKLKSSIIDEAQLSQVYTKIDQILTGKSNTIDADTWIPNMYGTTWNSDNLNAKIKSLDSLGLKSIGAACVSSKDRTARYGYYEARVKASKISMSSSFWFQGLKSEFDLTENIGVPTYKTTYTDLTPYKMATNSWDFSVTPNVGTPFAYTLTEKVCDKFYVFGMEWTDKEVIYYCNDKEISRIDLSAKPIFQQDKYIFFDTEVLNAPWVGWPLKKTLTDPSLNTFYVDWIRVWRHL